MGCSTSTQTSAVDTTRPSAKLEESNGASTTGETKKEKNQKEQKTFILVKYMILNKGSEISENINICPVGRYVPFTASILQVDKFDIVLFCHSKYVRV